MVQNISLLPEIEVLSHKSWWNFYLLHQTSTISMKLLPMFKWWKMHPPFPLHAQMSHTIFASSGTGIDDKYSVHPYKCVECKSHLVCLALWKSICSPIVEWRTTIVQNVVSHLVNQENWRATWSPTLGRKYTNVQNEVIHFVWLNT